MAIGGGDKNSNLVFVYGTLKHGFYNHKLLDELKRTHDATFIGSCTTIGTFPLVCGPHGTPYLINLPNSGHRIHGELYSVSSSRGLPRLDDLEGVNRGHYERLPVTIELEDGNQIEAEAYFAHQEYGMGLWRKCGKEGFSEFTVEMGTKYVRREDRPLRCSSILDIHSFIADSDGN